MRRLSALLGTLPMLLFACSGGGTTVEAGLSPPPSGTPAASMTSVPLDPVVTSIDDPHVAIDGGGGIHLIWSDDSSAGTVVSHIEVGSSGGEPEAISDAFDVTFGTTPVLVRRGGQVCTFFDAFIDESDPSTHGLFVRCLTDGEWSAPELVTREGITSTFDPAFDASGGAFAVATTPISSVTFEGQELSDQDDDAASRSILAIDSAGRYHVVWYELGQRFELNHRFSTDEGVTWSPIEALSGTSFFVTDPTLIAASDGTVHLFYEDSLLFHRVWTSDGGWGEIESGPDCGGDYAFALSADDAPVAACANISGVHLTTINDGTWTPLDTVDGSTNVPATAISLAVGGDGTRHVAWVTGSDPPELRYAAVPAG
jgi:hypothetical protein